MSLSPSVSGPKAAAWAASSWAATAAWAEAEADPLGDLLFSPRSSFSFFSFSLSWEGCDFSSVFVC
eukprot:14189577-Alexandrium_andersonii.AAC.1